MSSSACSPVKCDADGSWLGLSVGRGVGRLVGDKEGRGVGPETGTGAAVGLQHEKYPSIGFGQHWPTNPSPAQSLCAPQSAAVLGDHDGHRLGLAEGAFVDGCGVVGVLVGESVLSQHPR